MPRSRGFCPAPVVKPSFQFFSLSSKATNSVASVVFSCPWYVDGVVMSFLLHTRCQGMEKSLPTTVRRRNQWTSIVTNGVSYLQTNKINSTLWSYCHGYALPPHWSQACTPAARNGGAHDHHHRVYHRL